MLQFVVLLKLHAELRFIILMMVIYVLSVLLSSLGSVCNLVLCILDWHRYVEHVQLDISAKYKTVMEELQFLPVAIDG